MSGPAVRFGPHAGGSWACRGGSWPLDRLHPHRLRQPIPHGPHKGRLGGYALCPRCLSAGRRAWLRIEIDGEPTVATN